MLSEQKCFKHPLKMCRVSWIMQIILPDSEF